MDHYGVKQRWQVKNIQTKEKTHLFLMLKYYFKVTSDFFGS